ncbi:hypothetical protein [Sphingobium sp. B12D2B]|uniref:hypothetical protein n=1 Tax=Sphingobium sp. B12D2B TaxID=2940577 RepID=UPI0022259732|nr:hypothetical protein [Sphingobium sp. B12D2B]MCW2351713.1 hypothetical protein [Sphingobium sp. B12D2B]
MARSEILRADDGLLLLGRLDGRLQHHPCTDIFLARARLAGAATLAGLAGVPIAVRDLEAWIAGRSPPPRASEGLNDPVSVAAIFHIALGSDDHVEDPIAQATRNVLRTLLDDRAEAEAYGSDDLAHFGPLWRQVRAAADTPFAHKDLRAVAERVLELSRISEQASPAASDVVAIDGRSWELPPRARDRNWLIATAVPRMLQRAGFTHRIIPSLILLPKFLPPSPAELSTVIGQALGAAAADGLRDLASIEREIEKRRGNLEVTKRSNAPALARLLVAYPGLQASAVARLLNITPQGARKLLAALSASSDPMLV